MNIFREHLTADDFARLLDSTARRNLGGDIQFRAIALWIDTRDQEVEERKSLQR